MVRITPVAAPRLPEDAVLLTVDLGGVSGFCALAAGHTPIWGHESFVKGNPPAGRVFVSMGRWVDELLRYFGPALVSFESPYVPRFGKRQVRLANGEVVGNLPGIGKQASVQGIPFNNDVTRRLYGFPAIVLEHCDMVEVPVLEVQTGKVCKFFTNSGNWRGRENKKAATMRVCHAYGFAAATYDESDAIAVAMYLEALIWPRASEGRGVGPLFLAAGPRTIVDTRVGS